MAPLGISPLGDLTTPSATTNTPPQRLVLQDPLNPASPSSPFYIGRPMPPPPPSSSGPLPSPLPEWNSAGMLAICITAYTCLCNAAAAITMDLWNRGKRPKPCSRTLTVQWITLFAIWTVALPVVPVHYGLQLLVRAFLYLRYSVPADAENADDLEGQDLERHIDALDTTIEGNRSMFRRALVAYVGLPPLRAGKLSWAEENRCQRLQAREDRRAERRARAEAFWMLPPYDGVVLPPYETLVIEIEPETGVAAADTEATTTAAPGQGGGDGGFAQERVVGGREASFSTSQMDADTLRPPPPAYHA